MTNESGEIFAKEYIGENNTDNALPKQKSEIKEFLKAPIDEKEMVLYGTSKPFRKVIRAAIEHGKSQSNT